MSERIEKLKEALNNFKAATGSNDFNFKIDTNIEMIKSFSDEGFLNILLSIQEVTEFYNSDLN